jgi:cyclopropane fatty-acyl-phospholipid synthase-like methyltransferase
MAALAKRTIRIGGVPEHFNYLFTLAKLRGLYEKHNVDVEFVVKKCGTGAMIQALKNKEVDMIVALTEGLVADIAKGSDIRIFGTYVQSPLCWALSSGAGSNVKTINDMRHKTFGISRYGSGSHLMAYVLAMQRGWDAQQDIRFRVCGDFQALRDSVNADEVSDAEGHADAFLWETFTTKPYHDSGEVQRIGEITTPWPCFMVAGLKGMLDRNGGGDLIAVKRALSAIREAAEIFKTESEAMIETISKEYGILKEDARQWYSGVDIRAHRYVSQIALETALQVLCETGVLEEDLAITVDKLIDPRVAELQMDIKQVKLYGSNSSLLNRVYRGLEEANQGTSVFDKLSYQDLAKHDQTVYNGIDAVKDAIKKCKISERSHVLNVGSGMGGCARYLAGSSGCHVLACEMQNDLHKAALEFTERTGLEDKVHHMGGDFLQLGNHLRSSTYDAVCSWLTVLHFQSRDKLFNLCYNLTRPGGQFYAQDFMASEGGVSVQEREILRSEVYCSVLQNEKQYHDSLHAAGFREIVFEDMTENWKKFTSKRSSDWAKDEVQLRSAYGDETYEKLGKFYKSIASLFLGGRLKGVTVVAQKPMGW